MAGDLEPPASREHLTQVPQAPWRGKILPQEACWGGGLEGVLVAVWRACGAQTEFLTRCHGVRMAFVCGIQQRA